MRPSPVQKFDIRAIQSSWADFEAMTHLRPIHDADGYDRMVALMNALLDVVGDDEDHPLSGLLELVGDLVSLYEREHFSIAPTEPREALRFLMEARHLKQDELAPIVAQGNLSAILAGKRKISASLAGKLAKFFSVSPALFIPR
ncbi:MAG TPA: hypothetical protein PLW86_14330 [Rhodocyclaceae bacterium]|nr:hypothetical protein [Rhodocyclaceae bacterium]